MSINQSLIAILNFCFDQYKSEQYDIRLSANTEENRRKDLDLEVICVTIDNLKDLISRNK